MENNRLIIKYLLFFLLFIGVVFFGFYGFYFRDIIPEIYQKNTPVFWAKWVHYFYPRFAVEKQRFPIAFFITKADQVLLRMAFLYFLLLVWVVISGYQWAKGKSLFSFKTYKTCEAEIHVKLYFFVMLFFTWDWGILWQNLVVWEEFYEPISFLKIFSLPLLTKQWAWILWGLMTLAAVGIILSRRYFLLTMISFFLFLILQAYFLSFQKIDHNFANFTYAGWGVLWITYDLRRAIRQEREIISGNSLFFTQLLITLPYFEAGLEKLFISGTAWFVEANFKAHALLHEAELGLWFSAQVLWIKIVLIGVLCFQLFFIGVVFFPKLRWVLLPLGVLFHWGTYFLLGVGGWISPWWCLYVFFINWERYCPSFQDTKQYFPKF